MDIRNCCLNKGVDTKLNTCVPSKEKLQNYVTCLLAVVFICVTLWGLLEDDVLPGSEIFAILLLVTSCHIGGFMISFFKLPPLLGMLITGFLFRNLKCIPYYQNISLQWNAAFRNGALVIILLRAGLGLDPHVLKKMSFVCLRLAFVPCLIEAISVAVISHFLLGLPWSLAFCLGFVLGAVSPAVVVPSMLSLEEKGFGQVGGITTLLVAASSVDDVLAIAGFGLSVGVAFATGNLVWTVVKGPLQVIVGLAYGAIVGFLLWYFPSQNQENKILYRLVLLLFSALGIMYVSQALHFEAAGALGCLSLSFGAALHWRNDEDKNVFIEDVIGTLWQFLQLFLFGLVGAGVSVDALGDDIGKDALVLLIGIVLRLLATYCALYRSQLNGKEKVFVALAWLPKATVQAAIGSVVLDIAKSKELDNSIIVWGEHILCIAVLSIVITAPLGAVAIAICGPLLLQKSSDDQESNETMKLSSPQSDNPNVNSTDSIVAENMRFGNSV